MRFFRDPSRSCALALTLLVAALPGVPHFAVDDTACAVPWLEQHDASRHAIDTATTADHDHCAICHWARTYRTPLRHAPVHDRPIAASAPVPQVPIDGAQSATYRILPARAPPACFN